MANLSGEKTFTLISEREIPSLNLSVEEYSHERTGAQHIHLKSDSEENVFLVALRTVPEDSTGVAHILEHTALCGSKRYPVRDPFFMMTRRSLNTFMNAFTSSDWTAYPFSSLNKKDFNNLLDVYLDAVFFARLDPLDFAQEGHRLEFQDPENSDSPLVFKGVVFNEMKGAMSSVTSQLWQTLTKYLFPTSTYHFNSGGEPQDIPDLSYEDLREFYKTHYHPSNATFMTFGNIPAAEHQQKFEQHVLKEFDKLDEVIAVGDEKRYFAPIRIEESYACDEEKLSNKTHIVMAWLLGHSTDLEETLKAQLISSVLIDNSACPLMHALESTDLGQAPSPLCGLDDSQKQISFICGLSGSEAERANDVEALILKTLETIKNEGIPQQELEAALHQLELHQREIGGDSYPYGLQLILKSLTGATHRGNPASLLDLDSALAHLHEEIKKPTFVQDLIQDYLIDNPHRVRLTLTPDNKISARKERAEFKRLEHIKASLSDEEKQQIIEQTNALKLRQEQEDDASILPKVTLADVPEKERSIDGETSNLNDTKVTQYATGTNGLCYEQVIFPMPAFESDALALLSVYNNTITELGCAGKSYLEAQKRQSAVCGGVSAFSSIRGNVNGSDALSAYYVYSGKSLASKLSEMSELMYDYLSQARFDETSRMKEIVSQMRIGMEQSVTGNGHGLAMTAAAAGLSMPAYLNHKYGGLEAIQFIKSLDDKITSSDYIDTHANNLSNIHQAIVDQQSRILIIGEGNELATHANAISKLCASGNSDQRFQLEKFQPKQTREAWICNSQVNFCAKAFSTVPLAHSDSAALVVLSHYLRNGFLHRAIREQGGAYGGGASQDNNSSVFRFYSYRDPRMGETLDDFDASIRWLLNHKADPAKLEEAILGTIGGLDRSESPAGQAKRCFHSELHGRTLAIRDSFRQRVLNTSFDDLVRVAHSYLKPENASTAVVTGRNQEQTARGLGLEIIEL